MNKVSRRNDSRTMTPDGAPRRYILITGGVPRRGVPEDEIVGIIASIRRDRDAVFLGYDVHAGFYLPDLSPLAEVLRRSERKISVFPRIIDERYQSGKHPYSPTQVVVDFGGQERRSSVAKSRSHYVSQISGDVARVKEAYGGLSEQALKLVEPLMPENTRVNMQLSDIILAMHTGLVSMQLGRIPNVTVEDMKFDAYKGPEIGVDHKASVHFGQDVLVISVHKVQNDDGYFDYLVKKFDGHGLETGFPLGIIIPESVVPYVRV